MIKFERGKKKKKHMIKLTDTINNYYRIEFKFGGLISFLILVLLVLPPFTNI
jgi:hypothetical protein